MAETVTGQVWCTQPRRVAALTLADRVAEELQTLPPVTGHPNLVTCRAYGSGIDQSRAKVQFMTDFSLLNALYYQPTLPFVSVVVVDEVHERSVNTDLLVALLRRALALRSAAGRHPFKLVLTSATMNEALFARYFARRHWDASAPGDTSWAPVLKVGGRTFPVTISYATGGRQTRYERAAEDKVLVLDEELPATNPEARESHDILVFLPQADEVDRLARRLQELLPHCR